MSALSTSEEEIAPLSPAPSNHSEATRIGIRRNNKWLAYIFFCLALFILLNAVDIFAPLNNLFKRQALPERQVGGTFSPTDWSKEDDPVDEKGGDVPDTDQSGTNIFFPVDAGGTPKKYWPVVAEEHWNAMPRVFYPWNSTISWCENDYQAVGGTLAGLILVKVHKAASSTLAGVNLRIAHHVGVRLLYSTTNGASKEKDGSISSTSMCPSREMHQDSRKYRNRDPALSFMYSSIRDPAQRAISWIFYTMSNQGVRPTDEAVLRRLRARAHFVKGGINLNSRFMNEAGAQVGYMHTGAHLLSPLWNITSPNKVENLKLAKTRVAQVLQQYDFIVIVERIQESLVVLQLLLGLKTTDILYLSSKLSGHYSYIFQPNPGCHKLTKAAISPAVDAYLSSSHWYAQNYQDYLLYKAANQSLDLTIDYLGRTRFDKALAVYQHTMNDSKDCEKEAIFPCSSDGVHRGKNETKCYLGDWGCGYPCLDRRFGMG